MPSHKRGASFQVFSWKTALSLIAVGILVAILDLSGVTEETKASARNLASGQSPAVQLTPFERFIKSAPKDDPPDVRRIVIELKPGVWSEEIRPPLGCEYRIDWDTPTEKIKYMLTDGTILEQKMGDFNNFGERRMTFRFRSERGGKVLITIKGGWDFSRFFK